MRFTKQSVLFIILGMLMVARGILVLLDYIGLLEKQTLSLVNDNLELCNELQKHKTNSEQNKTDS